MTGINDKLPKEENMTEEVNTQEFDPTAPDTQGEIESLVGYFNEALAFRDKQQEFKENELTHAFMTVNQSIAALNSKIDIALEHLIDKGELNMDDISAKMRVKLEEAAELQKKAIQEALAKQAELMEKEASNS